MNVSAKALVFSVAMAIAGATAQAESIRSGQSELEENSRINSTRTSKNKAAKAEKVSRKKSATRKRSAKRVSSRNGRRSKYMPMVKRLKPAGLPIRLVDAVITMESGYNASARGQAGEVGLMQVKPATARMVRSLTGVKTGGSLAVPANNLRVGMAYLNWCYRRAKRNLAATIGCYNAGPGNMWKWQKFAVTRKYVRFVQSRVATN